MEYPGFQRLFKVLLWSKYWLPFPFQLSKVEVINICLAKFQVKIPIGRPLILNVKSRFAFNCRYYSIQKWPRIPQRSGTSWNKRHVTSLARIMYQNRHFQTVFLCFPVKNRVLLFTLIKAKEYWRHWTALTAGRFRRY